VQRSAISNPELAYCRDSFFPQNAQVIFSAPRSSLYSLGHILMISSQGIVVTCAFSDSCEWHGPNEPAKTRWGDGVTSPGKKSPNIFAFFGVSPIAAQEKSQIQTTVVKSYGSKLKRLVNFVCYRCFYFYYIVILNFIMY
jgi:hypothetical protein